MVEGSGEHNERLGVDRVLRGIGLMMEVIDEP